MGNQLIPATEVKQFYHFVKAKQFECIFLSIQEWPILTNYLPSLPSPWPYMLNWKSIIWLYSLRTWISIWTFCCRDQTIWSPLEVRQYNCLFMVSNRGQAIWPTSSPLRIEPLTLSLYLKVNQFDFALCETLGIHMYIICWLGSNNFMMPIQF